MDFVEENVLSQEEKNYGHLLSIVADQKEKTFVQKNISIVPDPVEPIVPDPVKKNYKDLIIQELISVRSSGSDRWGSKTEIAGEILRRILIYNDGIIPDLKVYRELCDLAGALTLAGKFIYCLNLSPLYDSETKKFDINTDSLEPIHSWYIKTRLDHKKELDQEKSVQDKELAREDISSIPDLDTEDVEHAVDLSFLGKALIEPIKVSDHQVVSMKTQLVTDSGQKTTMTFVSIDSINLINEKIYEIRSVVDTIRKELATLVTLTDGVKSFCKKIK